MSLHKVIQIAHKTQNSKSWDAPAAITNLLERVSPGGDCEQVEQLVVHMMVNLEGKKCVHRWHAMGVSFAQHLALLEIGKASIMKDWLE